MLFTKNNLNLVDENESKEDILKKQFIEALKKNRLNLQKNNIKSIGHNNLNLKYKVKEQNNNYIKKIAELKKENFKFKQNNKVLKEQRYKLMLDNKNIVTENKNLEKQLETYKQLLKEKENECAFLKKENTKLLSSYNKKAKELSKRRNQFSKIDKIISKEKKYLNIIQMQKKDIKKRDMAITFLNKKMNENRTKIKELLIKDITNLNEIDSLKVLLKESNNRINLFSENLSSLKDIVGQDYIDDMIDALNSIYSDCLESEDIDAKSIEYFNNIDFNDILNENMPSCPTKEDIYPINKRKLGYIKSKGSNGFDFIDVEGNIIPGCSVDPSLVRVRKGLPCEIYMDSKKPIIIRILSTRTFLKEERKFKYRKETNIKPVSHISDKNLIKFNGEKVLLVGGENKNKYVQLLKSRNIDVTWLNPFEKGLSRIDDECKKNTFVIFFEKHCSHSAVYKIKAQKDYCENSNKYYSLMNDNEENLLYKINYMLENKI